MTMTTMRHASTFRSATTTATATTTTTTTTTTTLNICSIHRQQQYSCYNGFPLYWHYCLALLLLLLTTSSLVESSFVPSLYDCQTFLPNHYNNYFHHYYNNNNNNNNNNNHCHPHSSCMEKHTRTANVVICTSSFSTESTGSSSSRSNIESLTTGSVTPIASAIATATTDSATATTTAFAKTTTTTTTNAVASAELEDIDFLFENDNNNNHQYRMNGKYNKLNNNNNNNKDDVSLISSSPPHHNDDDDSNNNQSHIQEQQTSDVVAEAYETLSVQEKVWRYIPKPLLHIGTKGATHSHGNSLRQLLEDHVVVKVKVNTKKFGSCLEKASIALKALAEENGAPKGIEIIDIRKDCGSIIVFGLPGTLKRMEEGYFPPSPSIMSSMSSASAASSSSTTSLSASSIYQLQQQKRQQPLTPASKAKQRQQQQRRTLRNDKNIMLP